MSHDHDWTRRIEGAKGPIYLAIADAIGAAVTTGTLRAGDRLPTHRALADRLGVDLTTITRAYAEARRRGLLQATVGRGTFIRGEARDTTGQPRASEGPVDLGMNLPPVPDDPPLQDLLRQGLGRLLTSGDPASLLTYRSGSGSIEERAAGAAWLRPTVGEVPPERILVCPGAQPALLAIMGCLAGAGDLVLTDSLTYPGLRGVAAQLGLRLVGVAGDTDGLLPEALEAACGELAPKALYCIPTIHNPSAVTMPADRRAAIAGIAKRYALPLIEDDAYGLLPSSPLPALASLAPEVAFHVATVSKVLSPAMRVAYVVAPDARRARRLSTALRTTVLMASPLLTGLMTAWIRDGTAATLVAAIRRECAARQRIAREVLPAGSFAAHPEGLHLWLSLPQRWNRLDFLTHLRRQNDLAVVPSDAFIVPGEDGVSLQPPEAVRVSLGAATDREALKDALRSLAAALQEEAPTPFSEVV